MMRSWLATRAEQVCIATLVREIHSGQELAGWITRGEGSGCSVYHLFVSKEEPGCDFICLQYHAQEKQMTYNSNYILFK